MSQDDNVRFKDQNCNAQIWIAIIGRKMIDPTLCSAKMGVCIRLCEKFLSHSYHVIDRGNILRNFRENRLFWNLISPRRKIVINDLNSLLSEFNEFSENHPKFWIISLLDGEIRDFMMAPKSGIIKI